MVPGHLTWAAVASLGISTGGWRLPRTRQGSPGPPRAGSYLHAVFTFEALATVMGHLVADEVGLPVEGLGTLVALVLPLLRVDNHVLLQAAGRGWGHWHPLPALPLRPLGAAHGQTQPSLSQEEAGAHTELSPPSKATPPARGRAGPRSRVLAAPLGNPNSD